jgi:predicted nucleotidyltransferase
MTISSDVSLLGSIVHGIFHEGSDIDLGIYYKHIPSTEKYFEMKEDILRQAQEGSRYRRFKYCRSIIRMQALKKRLGY